MTSRHRKPSKKLAVGQEYGRLLVLAIDGHSIHCRCSCGKEIIRSARSLREGKTKSCGCIRAEATSRRNTTHGGSKSLTYKSWVGMINAYNNPNVRGYQDCGGAGLKLHDAWLRYDAFVADMGERPSGDHILRRNDRSQPHSPDNCNWSVVLSGKRRIIGRSKFDMPEAKIQMAVVEILEKHDVAVFHVTNGGYSPKVAAVAQKGESGLIAAGMPDLMIVHDGKTYFLELKTKRGKMDDRQKSVLQSLESAGAITAVAHGLDAALSILVSWGVIPRQRVTLAA